MQFPGGRTHVDPIKRRRRAEPGRIGTITFGSGNFRKRKRIDERSQAIRVERLANRRRKAQGVAESAWSKCGCPGNYRLTEKFAASNQQKNLHYGWSERLEFLVSSAAV